MHTVCVKSYTNPDDGNGFSLSNGGGGASETSDATVSPRILYSILSLRMLQGIYLNWTNFKNVMKISGINPLNAELNPISHILALLGAHLIFHIRRIRVK